MIRIASNFALAAALGLYRAFIATMLWAWFVVPTFGARPLALCTAWGLCLLVTLTAHQFKPTTAEESRAPMLAHVLYVVVIYTWLLGLAAVAHWGAR